MSIPTSNNNILITGGSGLIGTRLTELLRQRGHHVSHLGRSKKDGEIKSFIWEVKRGTMDPAALQNVDAIIHLAGASAAKRWTKNRKREILESRTKSSHLLYEMLRKSKSSVKTFVSASGINYYGFGNEAEVFTEASPSSTDFLSLVTQQWEAEADKISELGIRVVKFRTGIVLSGKGGALKEIATPIKFFVGATLGSGKQLMSWIHIDDLCAMYIKAIEDGTTAGAYNAVGPNPVTNREMTKAIAKVLYRPLILPAVPAFVLKMMFGEMSELVLKGSKVSPEKIMKTGFRFKFTDLEEALGDLLVSSS